MKIIRLLRKRIRSKSGETLTETLVSLLIIVPAMVMLAGAIITAAKINYSSRETEAAKLPSYVYDSSGTVSISAGTYASDFSGATIEWGKDNNSIYYYFR